ncbi:hypothetical protein [Oleomonas cavernae]|nr:hypothetical protein [Oleomonas cavernae]
MNTVFVGGSRRVSSLPTQAKERLNNIIDGGYRVIIGDANGADKAVQKHFHDAAYTEVTIFFSGDHPRNNIGNWPVSNISPGRNAKGFQFYAAKDREMAQEADFGLMIWDGKSPGTALNVLRLLRAGKKAVLLNISKNTATNFKSIDDWTNFVAGCDRDFRRDLQDRALPEEWEAVKTPAQETFLGL